jgi:deoxyribose-phosphate aldolase
LTVSDIGRLGSVVDHTLLRAEATAAEIDRLCAEAASHHMFAVCVNPLWVERCRGALRGSAVKVVSVVDFPLGASTRFAKVAEAESVVEHGADEVDMVVTLGALKSGDWAAVKGDIRGVVDAVAGVPVKVIVESAALTAEELVLVCRTAVDAGAAYVKTSTGFHPAGGATTAAVALMRRTVGERVGVKASGGIRDAATAVGMIEAGATRIGTSAGVVMAECTFSIGGTG